MGPVGRLLPRGLRVGAMAAAFLLVSGCTSEPVTEHARKVESLYNAILVLSILIFVGVIGAVLFAVFRWKHVPGDDVLPPQTHGNTATEVVWTALPTAIVLVLFGMSYATLRDMDDRDPNPAAVINVRGYQWAWEFDYGDGKVVKTPRAGVPTMVVPVGETVRVISTSDNVIHSWFVPNFLFKKDVVPGRQNSFEFKVDIQGSYHGQCAEYCGTDHAKMLFSVRAVDRDEFDKWYAELTSSTCPDDATPAARLEIAAVGDQTQFDKDCLVAPANREARITFTNPSSSQPHNVAIARDAALKDLIVDQSGDAEIITSSTDEIRVPAQPPGDYVFFCQVHPNMKGTYQVKEGP